MTVTGPVGHRFVAAIPGMYPQAPKRNVIVAVLYLYGVGIAMAAVTLAG